MTPQLYDPTVEARMLARHEAQCKLITCEESHIPEGFLCATHEMQYVIKYGRPSERDPRLRGCVGTWQKILAI